MKILLVTSLCLSCFAFLSAAPAFDTRRIIIVPASLLENSNLPLGQTRGPFDFIGNWIQSTGFFPIEINVPDTFGAIGNNVGTLATNAGNFAQNVGTGFQTFTQNVGNGFQNFVQRVPILGSIIRPTGANGQKYYILVPTKSANNEHLSQSNGVQKDIGRVEADILEYFP
ncbi:hypothetical protein JTB14_021269 [Gonioctena quinquepunctata]|nr:hypothetical protein JTB14_021269 [Gonioctena quinquepunctata]